MLIPSLPVPFSLESLLGTRDVCQLPQLVVALAELPLLLHKTLLGCSRQRSSGLPFRFGAA